MVTSRQEMKENDPLKYERMCWMERMAQKRLRDPTYRAMRVDQRARAKIRKEEEAVRRALNRQALLDRRAQKEREKEEQRALEALATRERIATETDVWKAWFKEIN